MTEWNSLYNICLYITLDKNLLVKKVEIKTVCMRAVVCMWERQRERERKQANKKVKNMNPKISDLFQICHYIVHWCIKMNKIVCVYVCVCSEEIEDNEMRLVKWWFKPILSSTSRHIFSFKFKDTKNVVWKFA